MTYAGVGCVVNDFSLTRDTWSSEPKLQPFVNIFIFLLTNLSLHTLSPYQNIFQED